MHWEREDGEWVNFAIGDIDEHSKISGVKYVAQDMRMTRIAIANLLETRLMNKSFWEKYGLVVAYTIFFLVITISLVVIFWQWGGIVDKLSSVVSTMDNLYDKVNNQGTGGELVPASILPIVFYSRKWLSLKTL